ncbi:MAG: hypothetical protein GC160_27805 [Acidobacteria bacterium]|nr:hypothetical protein [Acidobacteriota bacterium]
MAQQFTPEHIHEKTDAQVGPLVAFLIFMGVTVAASFGFTVVLFDFFTQRAQSFDQPVSPLQVKDETAPEPQLQVVPGLDRRLEQEAETERLNGYGWVDENARVVHIPIEKAIDVLLEKGVPVRQTAAATEAAEPAQ